MGFPQWSKQFGVPPILMFETLVAPRMKLPAIPIPKFRRPDFSHLHRGSLIAAGIAVVSALLFIVIPDAQTAAHGLRSGHDVSVLVDGIRGMYQRQGSFAGLSNGDLSKIESRIDAGNPDSLQDGWLLQLKVRSATLHDANDAFVLDFVEGDAYACPRVVKAMASDAARITVADVEVSSSTTALNMSQVQALCNGPSATIEMTFSREQQ